MKICRLCLRESKNSEFMSVFHSEDSDIIEKIYTCVLIRISDNDSLPKTVCDTCLSKIKDWNDFREICLKANEILLSTNIKNPEIRQIREEFHEDDPLESNNEEEIQYLLVEDSMEEDYFNQSDENIEDTKNKYKCEICDKEFINCWEHLDHQSSHNGESVFKCDKCPEVFSCREDLFDHDANHERPCQECGKMIAKNNMKLHLITHRDRHMCVECRRRFNSQEDLLLHIKTAHIREDHICEKCGKRFNSKGAIIAHLKTHSDERPYNCKLCNYAGRTANAVRSHMETHSLDLFVCEVCSNMFKSTRLLNNHLRCVHNKEKPHQCTYCEKKFADKFRLGEHMRCHTGARPYQCTLCDKAFSRSGKLKLHMTTHGPRVWYGCEVCNKKFASKQTVSRHHCLRKSYIEFNN